MRSYGTQSSMMMLSAWISFFLFYLFSMASMFLRSSRSCQVLSSSLPENRRWCPVTHSAPLRGARKATLSTTSSTLAVLMCSENSISLHYTHPPSRKNAVGFTKVPQTPFQLRTFRCKPSVSTVTKWWLNRFLSNNSETSWSGESIRYRKLN